MHKFRRGRQGARRPAAESKEINLTAPEIAENGAVVPLSVAGTVPDTQVIYVFVEKNPNPLSAAFRTPAGTTRA